jgi:hypothetical protein
MTESATLLTPATNYAVVQMPQRAHPGVVFQGDSLFSLISELRTISSLLDGKEIDEASSDLKFIIENLTQILSHYENTLSKLNISLPYFKSVQD